MMNCELHDDKITAGGDAVSELYDRGFYGRVKGETLELSLVEGAYLLYRKKIEIFSDGTAIDFKTFFEIASRRLRDFELRYIVFKDLRERGYYTKMSPIGFRLYPRGGHPTKTRAHIFVYVVSERTSLPLQHLIRELNRAENARKRLILAIVDEESDITFYELKRVTMSGETAEPAAGEIKTPAVASLLNDRTIIWDPEVSNLLHNKYFFGKKLDEFRLQLSLVESGYLLDRQLIRIDNADADADACAFDRCASETEPAYGLKYPVYSDLRRSGLVAKTGFKFGTHFRVYKQFKSDTHSEYLVHTIPPDHQFLLPELSRAVRISNSVHKRMIFGYPDADGSGVCYIEFEWIRL